jgi:hypothetical protein
MSDDPSQFPPQPHSAPWLGSTPPPVHQVQVVQTAGTPGVYAWFIVYAVIMALIYLAVAGIGALLLAVDPVALDMDPIEARITGTVYGLIGAFLTLPYAVAPFLPRRRWVWIYDMVLICLGMTSCCTLPACIPMLIFWLRPETKQFFS